MNTYLLRKSTIRSRSQQVRKPLAGPETAGSPAGSPNHQRAGPAHGHSRYSFECPTRSYRSLSSVVKKSASAIAPQWALRRLPGRRPLGCRMESMGFQNASNRGPRHPRWPTFLSALASARSPRRILFRHPRDELLDLPPHTGTAGPQSRVGPLPGNELSMPPQNRVGRYDRGDLAQHLTAQPVAPHRQAAPLRIGQSYSSTTSWRPENAVLIDEIGDHALLLAGQPAGQGRHEKANGSEIDHGRESRLPADTRHPVRCV